MRLVLLTPLLFALGCPLAHDDASPTACLDDSDCFINEGEYCDRPSSEEEGVCRPQRDAGVKLDKGPQPDRAPAPDVAPDLAPGDLGGEWFPTDAEIQDLVTGPDQGGD